MCKNIKQTCGWPAEESTSASQGRSRIDSSIRNTMEETSERKEGISKNQVSVQADAQSTSVGENQ